MYFLTTSVYFLYILGIILGQGGVYWVYIVGYVLLQSIVHLYSKGIQSSKSHEISSRRDFEVNMRIPYHFPALLEVQNTSLVCSSTNKCNRKISKQFRTPTATNQTIRHVYSNFILPHIESTATETRYTIGTETW